MSSTKTPLTFMFLGRLTQEKGFDLVLQVAKRAQQEYQDRVRFFIFGDGPLKSQLLETMSIYNNIHYFGWTKLDIIVNQYLTNIHYVVMPSRCLETFGLSAGEMMIAGLPVIGPAQGGLEQFISKPFDTLSYKGNDYEQLQQCMSHIIEHHTDKLRHHYQDNAHKKALNYTSVERLERFDQFTGWKTEPSIINQPKTIILVSDFLDHIGGIESYVHNTKMLLEQEGYTVIIYGKTRGGKVPKWLKLYGIAQSLYNFRDERKLSHLIKQINPDLIRYHSVNRRLGRRSIAACRHAHSDCKKRLMIHDRGIATPYPSTISSYHQLPKHRLTLSYRLQGQSRWKYPLLWGKYLTTTLLWTQIRKNIDTILIPSSYMRMPLQHQIDDRTKIVELPHYLMIKQKTNLEL